MEIALFLFACVFYVVAFTALIIWGIVRIAAKVLDWYHQPHEREAEQLRKETEHHLRKWLATRN